MAEQNEEKLIAMEVIKGIIMKLEDVCNEEIPERLGPTASTGQLRRQYYKVKAVIEEISDLENQIKQEKKYTANMISGLAIQGERKLALQDKFSQFLVEANVENNLRNFRTAKREWIKRKEELEQSLNIDPGEISFAGSGAGSPGRGETNNKRAKLPNIQLSHFDGSLDQWFSFYETFRVMIHEDSNLSAVEKFNFLQSVLEGEAKDLVSGIPITEEGYKDAFDLIQERYGDNKKLIRGLNQEIIALPKSENYEDDEKLYLRIEKICRLLINLKQNVDTAPYYITLEGKLSPEVMDRYFLLKAVQDKDDWSMEKFRNGFKTALGQIKLMKDAQGPSQPRVKESTISLPTFFKPREPSPQGSKFRPADRGQAEGHRPRSNSPRKNLEGNNHQNTEGDRKKGSPYPSRSPSGSRSPSQERKWPCAFCDEKHNEIECRKYPSAEERRERCLKKNLCFHCLRVGHLAAECTRRWKCLFCRRSHHGALCKLRFGQRRRSKSPTKPENKEKVNLGNEINLGCVKIGDIKEISNFGCLMERNDKKSILKLVELEIFNSLDPTIRSKEYCLLDDGSQQTYVEEDLARKLKLDPIEMRNFQVSGIGGVNAGHFKSPIVEFGIKKNHFEKLMMARVLPNVLNAMPLVSTENVSPEQLKRNKIMVYLEVIKPKILIGNDQYNMFWIRTKKQLPSGLWLSESKVGDILNGQGKIEFMPAEASCLAHVKNLCDKHRDFCGYGVMENEKNDLKFEMDEEFKWEYLARQQENLQTLGLSDALEKTDEEIKAQMEDLISYTGTRYKTGMLWNELAAELPTNFDMAYAQLKSMLDKLRDKPEILKQVQQIFLEQEKLGFIERVPKEEIHRRDRIIHYLPHHSVFRADKEHTKVRQVFNAGAKRGDLPSLNECLYKGPNLLNDLGGVLLRSRLKKWLVGCDVSKAFPRIEVEEKDRDSMRVLWLEDPFDKNSELVVFRWCRVTFGIVCSPNQLILVMKRLLREEGTELADELDRDAYMDNLDFGQEEERKVLATCQKVKEIFSKADMPIREFVSNSLEIKKLPEEDLILKEVVKFLGIYWDTTKDEFIIKFPTFKEEETLTKRKIVSHAAKTFDPNGLGAPVMLAAKNYRQDLEERKKIKWDKPLCSEQCQAWKKTAMRWSGQELKVPRRVHDEEAAKIEFYELHLFCDASKRGFGMAIYLRTKGSSIDCRLIFGKSLIIPKGLPERRRTIPNLELHSAFLGSKYLDYVRMQLEKAIKIKKTQIWTDSRDVVELLCSTTKLDVFTRNRIKRLEKYHVCHIDGKLNPADVASRGATVEELKANELWWFGPTFLRIKNEDWPECLISYKPGMRKLEERINDENAEIIACFASKIKDEPVNEIVKLIKNASSWFKVKAVVAYLFRWKNGKRGELATDELKNAANCVIKLMQDIYPPEERDFGQLNLFKDELGIIRAKGRIRKSGLNLDAVMPIYLPRSSPIVKLLIMETHKALIHGGVEEVLIYLRRKFWIPKGRKKIRNVIFYDRETKCGVCARFNAKPFDYPALPELPVFRCKGESAFKTVGIDYFGPFKVKGLESKKVWGIIFTCLVMRAIHIELVTDCSAECFLRAFRRFARRRRMPTTILSDNGSSFVLASKAIKELALEEWDFKKKWLEIFGEKRVKDFMLINEVQWIWNTPLSPWRGGSFERLIGIVKRHLKRAVGSQLCHWEEFWTLLLEIERVVNERPITFVSSEEIIESLRPIDLLDPTGGKPYELKLSGGDLDEEYADEGFVVSDKRNKTRDQLLRNYKKALFKTHVFWREFYKSYLTSLRERYEKIKRKEGKLPKIGQVVIVKEEPICPRSLWKLGIIKELKSDRTAVIKIGNKELERATSLLFPLELEAEDELENNLENKNLEKMEMENCFHNWENGNLINYSGMAPPDTRPRCVRFDAGQPALFITDHYPRQLRATLADRDLAACTYEPPFWTANILGEFLHLSRDVNLVVVRKSEFDEGAEELIVRLHNAAILSGLRIVGIADCVEGNYYRNRFGSFRQLTSMRPLSTWQEELERLERRGFPLSRGNFRPRVEWPRIPQNQPVRRTIGLENNAQGNLVNAPYLRRERERRNLGGHSPHRRPIDFGRRPSPSRSPRRSPPRRERGFSPRRSPARRLRDNSSPRPSRRATERKAHQSPSGEAGPSKRHSPSIDERQKEEQSGGENKRKGELGENELSKMDNLEGQLGAKIEAVIYLSQNFFEDVFVDKDDEEIFDKELEKLANNLYDEQWEIKLAEEFTEIREVILREFKLEAYAFGSMLNGLSKRGSDLDLNVEDPRNELDLGKLRRLIIMEYGRKNIRKAEIRPAKVPILDMEILSRGEVIPMQLSLDNNFGARNSIWIGLLAAWEIRFKHLYYALSLWAEQSGIKNSQNGTFSSYGLSLLIVSYLQNLWEPILPSILEIIKRQFNEGGMIEEKTLLLQNIKAEVPDFKRANTSTIKLLCGFFKYYIKFDFANLAIVPDEGLFLRDNQEIRPKKPVMMIDPFDGNNVGKCISQEGFFKIKSALSVASNAVDKGLDTLEDFWNLIRLRGIVPEKDLSLEKENLRVAEEAKNLSAENLIIAEGANDVDMEVDASKEASSSNSGKYLGANLGIIFQVVLISLLISLNYAASPMICHRGAKSNLIKFEEGNNNCAQLAKLFNNDTKRLALEVFTPNVKEFVFEGWKCFYVKQSIDYRTDFLNYKHQRPVEQQIIRLSAQECKNWLLFKKCEDGELVYGNEEEWHTNNKLELEYTYFSLGWQKALSLNCFVTKVKLIGKPADPKINSLTEEVTHCEFKKEECLLKDGSVILWELENKANNLYDQRMCKYRSAGMVQGTASYGLFYSKDTQRAMVFDENAERIESCGRKLHVSNTGLAIRESDYEEIMSLSNKRVRRELPGEEVTQTELLSRMQADAVFQYRQNRINLENLVDSLCGEIKKNKETIGLTHLNPSLFVREKLENEFLEAIWVKGNLLEYWPCTSINYTIRGNADGHCFEDVPINISIGSQMVPAFAHPLTLIVKATSKESECETHRYITFELEGELVKLDQWNNELRRLEKSEIKTINMKNQEFGKLKGLDLHIFRKDALNNFSAEHLDILQLLHPLLGHRGIVVEAKEKRGNWFKGNGPNWTLGGFLSNFDYWEYLERIICIGILLYLCGKVWMWKQKLVVKKYAKRTLREDKLKNFERGSVADRQRFNLAIKVPAKGAAETVEMEEMAADAEEPDEEELANLEKRRKRRRQWI